MNEIYNHKNKKSQNIREDLIEYLFLFDFDFILICLHIKIDI